MRKTTKPPKPYEGFPLYAHASGHWAKTILCKTHYFGRWEDGWQAALDLFNDRKEALYRGVDPAEYNQGLTVGLACDTYMSAKQLLMDSGELSPRTFKDYEHTCDAIVEMFTSARAVDSLTAADFTRLRAKLAARFGASRLSREIGQVRMVFKYAYDAQLIERPVRFGPTFKPPNQRTMRLSRAAAGHKFFGPEELRKLVDAATVHLRAMILLGINAAFENHDCGQLTFADLDLAGGWHTMRRPKTGIDRRAKLWPETVAALEASIAGRSAPSDAAHGQLVFVTKYGGSWHRGDRSNPLSHEFRKLLQAADLYRAQRTFLALRHTFETVAGETRDQVAVNHVMGHVDTSMAAVYRESISDARLVAVSDFVYHWLFAGRSNKASVG